MIFDKKLIWQSFTTSEGLEGECDLLEMLESPSSEVGSWIIANDVDIQENHTPQADICGRCLVGVHVFEDGSRLAEQRTIVIP